MFKIFISGNNNNNFLKKKKKIYKKKFKQIIYRLSDYFAFEVWPTVSVNTISLFNSITHQKKLNFIENRLHICFVLRKTLVSTQL